MNEKNAVKLEDFQEAVSSDLAKAIPTVAQLNPVELLELWKKLPRNQSKQKVFTGAIALFIDYIAKESKK